MIDLEKIANNMAKSEIDHWINEIEEKKAEKINSKTKEYVLS